MGLSGKLLGAGIGFFLGGPLGAVLGGVIGHFVTDAPPGDGDPFPGIGATPAWDPRVHQQQQEFQFVASLVGILSVMVRVDGDVRAEEVRAVRRFFSERLGYRGESLEIVKELLKRFLRDGVDLQAVCLDLKGRTDYATRLLLMECLREVAGADGQARDSERAILDDVARLLGIEPFNAASRGAQGNNGKDFRALGVEPSATAEEIKSAYRELAKKYHPDKVGHLGEEFRELAHRKFLEIQGAYERVRASRGF